MSVHRGALPLARVAPDRLEAFAFLAVVIAVSWPVMLVAGGGATPLMALAMWLPGIAAFALTRLSGGGYVLRRLALDRLGWPDAYMIAIWLPVVFAVGQVALAVAVGGARLDDDVGGLHPASGAEPVAEAVQQLVAAITIAPLANALVMVGAELGWRAYFLPRLLPLGSWRAVTLTSLFWWLWQLPVVTDLTADRWPIEAGAFLFWCLFVGEILGWLYLRTRSVWAPALFSGAMAAMSYLPVSLLRDVAPDATGPAAPIALVLPLIAVLVIRARANGDILRAV